jgi:CRISPR-associated endonuclease Csy4
MLYGVVVTYLPKSCDHALLAGRCIKVLHGFMSRHSISNIAVSFPKWSQTSVGKQLMFISPLVDQLNTLIQQPYYQMMSENGLFEISDLMALEQSNTYVKFVRNQSIDKLTPAAKARRLRRAKKRALERGEEFNPIDAQPKEIDFFHSIPMDSSQSGRVYMLRIQRYDVIRTQANDSCFEVCSYGLSTNLQHQALLPI